MRGEQPVRADEITWRGGSPPLARGTDKLQGSTQRRVGITPACAGNSHRDSPLGRRIRDHPRLRGEQIAGGLADLTREGSPPLARGTVTTCPRERKYAGITPACAGNSPEQPHCLLRKKDHPRLRGEQSMGRLQGRNQAGSPPLARGTDFERRYGRAYRGITPACAGNRNPACPYAHGVWDHPRLRGEQFMV